MQVYNYDAQTKEYLNSEDAILSPLEKDIFLLPANSTDIIPPKTKVNEVVIFNGSKWIKKKDYRGQTIYNIETKEAQTVDYIGNIQSGFTLLKPFDNSKWNGSNWELDKELILNQKLIELTTTKNQYIAEGVAYQDINFYADKEAFLLIKNAGIDMLQAGQKLAIWKGIDGVLLNPTLGQMQHIFNLVALKLQNSFVIENSIKEKLLKLTAIELKEVDISQLWNEMENNNG